MAGGAQKYYPEENELSALRAALPMPKGQRAYPTTDGPSPIMGQIARLDAVTCQLNEFLEQLERRLSPISVSAPTGQNVAQENLSSLSPVAEAIAQSCYRVDHAMMKIVAMMDALQL